MFPVAVNELLFAPAGSERTDIRSSLLSGTLFLGFTAFAFGESLLPVAALQFGSVLLLSPLEFELSATLRFKSLTVCAPFGFGVGFLNSSSLVFSALPGCLSRLQLGVKTIFDGSCKSHSSD